MGAVPDDPGIAALAAQVQPTLKAPQRGNSTAFYREVAAVYLEAVRAGSKKPTQAVARRWEVSGNLAATWVHRGRQQRFLPAAPTRGQALRLESTKPGEDQQ